MEKNYFKEVKAKKVKTKEISDQESKVQQEILESLEKTKDSFDHFSLLETGQSTSQAASSASKTGTIVPIRSGDDKIRESCLPERPDITESSKDREKKIEKKKFQDADVFQEEARHDSIPLGERLIPDVAETNKNGDCEESPRKLETQEDTSGTVPKKKTRLSLRQRLVKKGLKLHGEVALRRQRQQILKKLNKDKDFSDTSCSSKTRQNTSLATSSALKTGEITSSRSVDDEIEKSASSEKPDVAGVSSTPDAVEYNKEEESQSEGLSFAESFKSGDIQERSKTCNTNDTNLEDVTDGECHLSLRRKLQGKGQSLLGEPALKKLRRQIQRTSDKDTDSSNNGCSVKTRQNTSQATSSALKTSEIAPLRSSDENKRESDPPEKPDVARVSSAQKGNNNPEVFDPWRIEQTAIKGVESSSNRGDPPEASDLLESKQKKFGAEKVRRDSSSLEKRLIPVSAESNKNRKSRKQGSTSTESFEDGDTKQSVRKFKTKQDTSLDTSSASKTEAIESLRSVGDKIQKSGLSEELDVADSNKDGECNKQSSKALPIEEIVPKAAASSLQEGNNNSTVSDPSSIEQTKSKDIALPRKKARKRKFAEAKETSESLELEQKKLGAHEVSQEKVQHSSGSAHPMVFEENQSCVHESLKKDDSTLESSSTVPRKSETVQIPLETLGASLTEEGQLKSTNIENQSKVSESLENTCETSKNPSSLKTTDVKNESSTAQETTVKKKKKKKKKKPKLDEGQVESQPANQVVQPKKQENVAKKKANENKVNPPKKPAKLSRRQRRLAAAQGFPFTNVWQYPGSRSNIPMWQEPLSGFPPVLPIMPRNLAGNPRHFLYQSLLGNPGLASLIQGHLGTQATPLMNQGHLGTQATPFMNQESFLGNRGVSPLMQMNLPGNLGTQATPMMNQESFLENPGVSSLMQVNLPGNLANLPINQANLSLNQTNIPGYQGNLSGDPGHLSRYYENLGDQSRNNLMMWNEANLPNNEVKLENADRSQGSEGRLSRWDLMENLPGNQDSKERIPRWEPIANLPGNQEYPSRYQEDLSAQPSTSRSEVQSGDSYHTGEHSSGSRKRRASRDSQSPDDCKRTKFSESELACRNDDLTKLIISKDFGKLRLGQEEMLLIRIAISQEIDRIPKGHIPKFNDTYLRFFGIVVDCADEWSRDWLADAITKISPWSGARLRLVDLPLTEKFYDAVIFIPGVLEKAEIILGRLERQNPALKSGSWKVYAVEEKIDLKGFDLKVGIPPPSLKALEELNFKPFLGMTKVTVAPTKSVRIFNLENGSYI